MFLSMRQFNAEEIQQKSYLQSSVVQNKATQYICIDYFDALTLTDNYLTLKD